MKTDFSMLWVDDQKLLIEALAMDLRSWLDSKGFELKILIKTDADNVIDEIQDETELIVIDYKLPGKNGDVLIQEIRNRGYYQDIIFYSEESLPDIKFDGVFYVRKQDAERRIKDLINLKLWRSSDPASVRGWIVADAIELEWMVTDLLSKCFSEKDGFTFSDRFLYSYNSPIGFGRKVDILKGIFNDLIEWLSTQPKNDDIDIRIDQLSSCNKIYTAFKKEIVEVRNAVAHQRVEENDKGKFIKTKKITAISFDEANLTNTRNNLRKHYKNLVEIQKLL